MGGVNNSTSIEHGCQELVIDLTDGSFYTNLSWSNAVDYLNSKPMSFQKRFLGMQGASSDVVWRFYKKQATERVQLKKIYETKMHEAEQLVKHTLANETIVANQQVSIDKIFEILRSRDLVGNPFGFTMGRNYRFFANLKVQMRRKLSSELDVWKGRNEAAAAQKKTNREPLPPPASSSTPQGEKEKDAASTTAASKDEKSSDVDAGAAQTTATDTTVENKE